MTKEPISFQDVIDLAISREEQAHEFYTDMAQKVEDPFIRKEIEGFAKEELGHKAKLEDIKSRRIIVPPEKIKQLGIAEQSAEVEPTENMDYEDLLIIAMKKEKEAFWFYNMTASIMDDAELEKLFLMLAQEEAKHKLRFEVEYDEKILKEK